MKIINKSIRPIGFITVELNEIELQSLIETFEQLQMILNQSEIKGIRGELYKTFKELLK